MLLPITSLLSSVLAIWYLVLTARVIAIRRDAKISLGDGDNPVLLRRMRAQGNFAEYVPIGLVLFALAEIQSINAIWLALLAVTFAGGRIAHGYGFSFTAQNMQMRVVGMMATLIAIGLLSVSLIALIIIRSFG